MEVTTFRPEVWNVSSVGGGGGNWSCEPAPTLTQASWVRAWVLSAMAALSLLGNAATIASIHRRHWAAAPGSSRHQPSAVYALILHLSAADLLVTVFCIAGEAAWSYAVQWLAGNAACKLFKFAQVFSLYLSTFILVLIGIDRFVAVRYPMRALGTANRLGRLVAAAWGLSALLSLPQARGDPPGDTASIALSAVLPIASSAATVANIGLLLRSERLHQTKNIPEAKNQRTDRAREFEGS
ncbi:gonadotropin-releasing hormone II receptor-like [Schistocerca nitens]|uniref:gonadotropin-releasing hormone II receptor-like n=1 Tax=Schistocerca nitens TaxID=7011 RepID=UPI002118E0CC|nr:gonadotropin-releasing hormone II receptor-like [Schistocerca nitens]